MSHQVRKIKVEDALEGFRLLRRWRHTPAFRGAQRMRQASGQGARVEEREHAGVPWKDFSSPSSRHYSSSFLLSPSPPSPSPPASPSPSPSPSVLSQWPSDSQKSSSSLLDGTCGCCCCIRCPRGTSCPPPMSTTTPNVGWTPTYRHRHSTQAGAAEGRGQEGTQCARYGLYFRPVRLPVGAPS